MTTPSVDRPVSEPMMEVSIEDRLARHADHAPFTLFAGDLRRIIARALPLPRRYTGGPLEDGLYLWRPALWGAGLRDWASIDTSTLTGRYDFKEIVDAEAEVWLIGPISIPPIPESEEA